jgi:hypothetical protein
LVPANTSSLALIDHSEAVATVTGTAGWEAIVRETPAIVFGHAWYGACESVYNVHSRDDVADAITDIQAGTDVDPQDVRTFAASLVNAGYAGWLGLGPRPDGLTDEVHCRELLATLRTRLSTKV